MYSPLYLSLPLSDEGLGLRRRAARLLLALAVAAGERRPTPKRLRGYRRGGRRRRRRRRLIPELCGVHERHGHQIEHRRAHDASVHRQRHHVDREPPIRLRDAPVAVDQREQFT